MSASEIARTIVMSIAALTSLPFADACEQWLDSRRPYISEKTAHEYQLNINTLAKHFYMFRLTEITADDIRKYQRSRMAQCGPYSINHECSVLQQVLKRIGRWGEVGTDYQPLPLPQQKRGMSITDDERVKLWRIMRANPDWTAARLAATISINSTASPGELYKLKLRDIEMDAKKFWIGRNGAKNAGRIRRNPINDECWDAFREAISRAKILGAYEPHHYLFPFRKYGNEHDPERHQTTFRTAWDKIIAEAVRQGMTRLQHCRLEDMRHSANTRLLENENVSEATYEQMAGHKVPVGKKYYFHADMERKQKAVDALSMIPKKPAMPEVGPISTDNSELAKMLLAVAAKLLNAS